MVAGSTAGAIASTLPVTNVRPEASVATVAGWPTLIRDRCSDGTLAASSTRSMFAISAIGCAAVPSTCSPTLTMRLTTWPAIGERTDGALDVAIGGVRARRSPARAPPGAVASCAARVLHFLAGGDAALEQLLVALQVQPRVLELRLRLLDGGGRLPPLILERLTIELAR